MGWTSQYTLENENGQRYELTAPGPVYLVNVEGLGIATSRSFGSIGGGFFLLTADEVPTNPITGDLIYQVGAFENYQQLLAFISQAKTLYFCYAPLDTEYRCRVRLNFINKERRDSAGWMRAAVSFFPLTPWYQPEAAEVAIDTGGPDSKAYLYHSGSSTKTASGAIASFSDGVNAPVVDLTVSIEPVQSGSGDPSPDNVRPISGWTGANIHVSPTTDAADGTTYSVAFLSEAGTVYGGALDVTTGKLTVDRAIVDMGTLQWNRDSSGSFYVAYSLKKAGSLQIVCSELATWPYSYSFSGYASYPDNIIAGNNGGTNKYFYAKATSYATAADFKTAMSGVQMVYELATPIEYTLTPTEVRTLLGANNIWADTGDSTVEYQAGTNYYYTYNDALAYGPEVSGDLTKRIYPAGHEPSGLLIRYTGAIENPVISLVGTSGRVYGECHINETFAAGETIELCTAPDNSYIHKISGGVVTDLMAASKVDLAFEPYPRAPVDEACVLTIDGDNPVSGAAELTVYRYYRSV